MYWRRTGGFEREWYGMGIDGGQGKGRRIY